MEVARPVRGPQSWGRMARATLGVGVPLAAGLITGAIVPGVLIAVGGLIGALAERSGPYPIRARAIALAGAGGTLGVALGTAIHGRGGPAVAVLVAVAGLSALISATGIPWSVAAFCLLVYTVLGTGPLGAVEPAWLPATLVLVGVGWSVLLLVPEWAFHWSLAAEPRPRPPRRTGAARPTPGRGTLAGRLPAMLQQARLTFSAVSGVRLMLCIAVAGVLSEALPLGRSYWVVLAVALVVKPDFGSSFARAVRYAGGAVLGAMIGGLIVATGPRGAVLLAPVVVLAALLPFGTRRGYGLSVLLLTPLVMLLLDTLSTGGPAVAEGRLVDVLLGCAVVLGIGYAPWPGSWHANVPRAFARVVDRAADYLNSTLPTSIEAPVANAQAGAHKELAALRLEFRRAMAEPDPARRRVLAWRPPADALEPLLDAVTATRTSGAEPATPTEVAQVNEALRDIAAAARSGEPTPSEPSLPASPSLRHVTECVRRLSRALQGVAPPGDGASVLRPTRLPGRGE